MNITKRTTIKVVISGIVAASALVGAVALISSFV